MPECFDCKLAKCRRNIAYNVVVPGSDICFIAEAPGQDEDAQGIPLVGRAGKLFNGLLLEAGLQRERCTLCNTVRCRPPCNRDPEEDEISACSKYLENDIKLSGSKIIIPLGAISLARILGKKKVKITKMCGDVITLPNYPGIKIIPAIHPAALLRSPAMSNKLLVPLQIAKTILDGTYGTSKGVYEQVTSKEQALEVLSKIADASAFAFDIEYLTDLKKPVNQKTVGKKRGVKKDLNESNAQKRKLKAFEEKIHHPINGHIVCCSFSINPGHGWWIVWEDLISWVGDLFKILMSGDKVKIVHNCMCELKWLRHNGYPMSSPVYDTMIAEYLLDESEKAYSTDVLGLKRLALKYTNMGNYAEGIKFDPEDPVPLEKLGPYCAKDSDAALRVRLHQLDRLAKSGMETVYYGLLMPSAELLSRLELSGAVIDTNLIEEVKADLQGKIAASYEAMKPWLKDSNPRSPKQLISALQENGVVLTKLTKGSFAKQKMGSTTPKQYTVCEDVIEELAAKHIWLRPLLDFRKNEKIRSTYTDSLLELLDSDGRVRTNYSLCYTDTGRLASRGPNLQNIANEASIRNLFVAPDGFSIVQADASQAELRWGAIHTGDPTLIRLLNDSTVDIHRSVAAEVAGIPVDKVSDEMRKKIKPVNFGIFYGAQERTVALEAGISIEEATELIRAWFSRFHFVLEWKNKTIENARSTGYVESKFGRRRRLPGLNSPDKYIRAEAERQCINAPVQADASDMTLMGSLKVDAALRESGFLNNTFYKYGTAEFMTVHDSVMYYIELGRELDFVKLAKPILEDFPIKIVPMKFDFEFGKRWGSLEKLKI